MSMWPVASDICTPEPGSSTQRAARSGLGDRLLTPGAPQTREKSHAAFLADEEEIAPLEEFERDVGERLRLLGADGATCIINDREVVASTCHGPSFPHWPLTLRARSVVPQRRRRVPYHTAPPARPSVRSAPAARTKRRCRRGRGPPARDSRR